MQYRPDIDGLRAVAVVCVIISHFGLGLSGGYIGVDVFFVISGYLIASLMLREMNEDSVSLVGFWERRIRRIFPALFVVVAATLIAGWFVIMPKEYQLLGTSVKALVEIRINRFFSRQDDYFGPASDQLPLLHTWSLAVEEQFYLLVPLIFWAAAKWRRKSWLIPVLSLLTVLSFAAGVYGSRHWSQQSYYLLSTRAWEMLSGVLAACVLRDPWKIPRVVRELAAAGGLAAILLAALLFNAKTPLPGWSALLPVGGALMLIATGGGPQASVIHRLLSSRIAVGIGLISYSLYLWHWPLMVIAKLQGCTLTTFAEQALLVGGTVVLAYITYQLVEQPFRQRRVLAGRRPLLAGAAVGMVALALVGHRLHNSGGAARRMPAEAQLILATSVGEPTHQRRHTSADVPNNLTPFGATGVAPTVLVWGDSHAMVLLAELGRQLEEIGVAGREATSPGLMPNQPYPDLPELQAFSDAAFAYAKSPEIQLVVLAARWHIHPDVEVQRDVLRTVDALKAAGKKVYFVKDAPAFPFHVPTELARKAWQRRNYLSVTFSQVDYDKQNAYLSTLIPELERRKVTVIDPLQFLRLPSGDLASGNSEGSFYYDGDHLSLHGTRVAGPMFFTLIDDLRANSGNTPPPVLTAERPRDIKK